MAVTKIADVIVPEIFTPYVIEKTAEKSKILQSGIAIANPKLNELVTAGGKTMNMPFWQDLTGDDEIVTESAALTPGKITAGKDVACLLIRGRAWGAHELAGAMAGSDPMAAIGDLVADYWARREQKILISVLQGVFAASSMSGHVLDKSAATGGIDGTMVLDAKQLMGDAADKLQAVMMHSAVYTQLQKQGLITTVTSVGPDGSNITIEKYLTYDVIVDDGMPVDTTGNDPIYTTYLFARGSIGRGEGVPVSLTPTETDRDSLGSQDYLINRKALVMHPMGIKWKGTSVLETPSNTELATGTNWELVYESKNVGLVAIKHKLA